MININKDAVIAFVETNKNDFYNIWNNKVLDERLHPNNPLCECYLFELKESLLATYLVELQGLNSEMYESAADYLKQYPPIYTEI